MEKRVSRSLPVWLLLLTAAIASIQFVGTKDFYTRGEPREALVSQNMLLTGNWILPEGYGGVVPSKPPFMHWLIALFSLPTHEVTEFTARLPSAVAFIFFTVFFYIFLKPRVGDVRAIISTLLLATSVQWFGAAVISRVDMLLACCSAGALFSLYHWNERKLVGVPLIAILLLTGATLTKGPIGFILPGTIFAVFALLRGTSVKTLFCKAILVLIPVIGLASVWYYLAYMQRGDQFIAKVRYENLQRFTGTMDEVPHKKSFFYLWGSLVSGFLPWSVFLIGPIKRFTRFIFSSNFNRFFTPRTGAQGFNQLLTWLQGGDALTVFSSLAVFIFVAFYSIPASKRGIYLLAAYPFVALLLSAYFTKISDNAAAKKMVLGIVAAIGVGCGTFLAYSFFASGIGASQFVRDVCAQTRANWILILLASLSAGVMYGWLRKRTPDVLTLCLCALYILGVGNSALTVPYANAISGREFTNRLQKLAHSDAHFLSWGTEFYGLSFYLKHRLDRLDDITPQVGDYVFVADDDIASLKNKLGTTFMLEFVERSLGGVTDSSGYVALFRLVSI